MSHDHAFRRLFIRSLGLKFLLRIDVRILLMPLALPVHNQPIGQDQQIGTIIPGRSGHLLFQPLRRHQTREEFPDEILNFFLRNRPAPEEQAQGPSMLRKQLLDQLLALRPLAGASSTMLSLRGFNKRRIRGFVHMNDRWKFEYSLPS